MKRWLVRVLGLNRRYGVRYAGDKERSGFTSRTAAEVFGQDSESPYVVYEYDPIDLRVQEPNRSLLAQDRYIGGGP